MEWYPLRFISILSETNHEKKKDLSIIGFIFPISLYILKTTMYLLVIYYGRVTLCVI